MAQETNPRPLVDKTVEFPAPKSGRRPPPLRRRWKGWQMGALLGVLLLGGLLLWHYLASYESTDDAQVDVHLYPVSARVSGYVIWVNVGTVHGFGVH